MEKFEINGCGVPKEESEIWWLQVFHVDGINVLEIILFKIT